ncbi:MAG: hypothetical protein PHX50_10620 [Massilibacteroides sp.]|jgi:hypothetical protein|nr:hypothetical protein [Massilibacteroides sp.]
MIKAEATVNGIISRSAMMKTGKDGKPFTAMTVKVDVTDRNGGGISVEISVGKDGYDTNEAALLTIGQRVEIVGTMNFKKRSEHLYVNLSAKQITLNPASKTDSVTGDVEFKGTLGKQIDRKNDKNGSSYQIFSGFSTEKVAETFEFTWVRFVRFSNDECKALAPSSKVEIKGELELGCYQEKLNLSCRVNEISEWVKQPFPNTNQNA